MALINPKKKYKDLITFGCSYTTGFKIGEAASWGYNLSQLLGCNHVNKGGSQSNHNIVVDLLAYCETNDMTDCCVGIQWSDISRREYWDMYNKYYFCLGLGILKNFGGNKSDEFLDVINDNLAFFQKIWYERDENVLRTINSIVLTKNYLANKNIDFVMFEGINSIMDVKEEPNECYPINHKLALTTREYKQSLLDDDTFFNELGNLHISQMTHPDYGTDENETHPGLGVVKWWTKAMYDYMCNIYNV